MDDSATKRALRLIPYGLFVVGARDGDEIHAFTGSWMTQASVHPPMVAIGVKRTHRSHRLIQCSQAFSISFLDERQKDVALHFFRTPPHSGDRLGAYDYEIGSNG